MSRALRLIFLNTRLPIGGPAKVTTSLAEELASRGHSVILASGDPEPGEVPDPRAERSSLPRVHVKGLRRPLRPWSDPVVILRVCRLLRERRPDALITAGAKAGAVGRIAARLVRPRPRTVHVFHGHVFRGHFSGPVSRVFASAERWLARITDDLVAICESVERDLRSLGIDRSTRLHRIFIGCDFSPFLAPISAGRTFREELGIGPTSFLAVCPARVCHVKAQDVLIEAVGIVRASLEDREFLLVFVGDGTGVERLRARARELGIEDRIRFVGYREDMVPVYAAADLVVLASRSEGTPVSLLESVAAGCPVLATSVGGVPEIFRQGMGWLVPPEDPLALGTKLSEIIARGRPSPVAELLRREVVDRFSTRRVADEFERLLTTGTV